MDAIKKQATRFREQVAKQQQALLKHLGHFGHESVSTDEAELQCHQQLEKLYNSTRSAKHFQRNIVRCIEGFISASTKQMEIVRRLSQDCSRYGTENESSAPHLAKAALTFASSHNGMEDERETLLGFLTNQVSQPLRSLITGAPLEDARHLTHRYDKLRQEVDSQAAEVLRRRSKTRESDISAESCMKLRNAEERLSELRTAMAALGKEAVDAMLSVEAQQQQTTFEKLCIMVDAERVYHQQVIDILEKLYAELIEEEQSNDSLQSITIQRPVVNTTPGDEHINLNGSKKKDEYYIAQVVHPFDAQSEGELTLSEGDYVVVRQVAPHGWSEGEYKGKAGWFPSAYVKMEEKAPASKLMEQEQVT
ncbi:SH3 domain-containing protein 1-like [Rutidosis leptorrhynchoides]|uniref:SH3 domain-containing protein 1-like n=1 Tax=Rutidosis leptorrhynchoides TaxID=125765 RepID=UPI003A998058